MLFKAVPTVALAMAVAVGSVAVPAAAAPTTPTAGTIEIGHTGFRPGRQDPCYGRNRRLRHGNDDRQKWQSR